MKIIDRIKGQLALQKKKYMNEVLEQENKSQQKTALKLLAGFFAFMLLFTVLSRVADGMTIAKVNTETLGQGNVVHEIKATGEVFSDSRQALQVVGDLLIDKVFAKQGQNVKGGEVLMSFDKATSEILLNKLSNEIAELNLKKETASSPDEASLITAKRNLDNAELDYKRARSKAEEAIKLAEQTYQKAISDYDKLYSEYDYKGYTDKRWKNWIEEPVLTEEDVTSLYPSHMDEEKEIAWKANMLEAREALKTARQKCIDSERAVDAALKADESEAIANERSMAAARLSYDEALKSGDKAASQAAVDNQGFSLSIKEKQSDLAILQSLKKDDWKLKAPSDGVLLSIKGEAGTSTVKGEAAALSKNAEGYKVDVSVTKEQMDYIKQGDEVDVSLIVDGRKSMVEGVVQKVAPAQENDGYELTVGLPEGVYLVGDKASVSYTQTSEQYYTCLPINALRSDSDGSNFVLVAVEKDTVLGKEAVAKRVNIEITDRDTKTMSVQSSLLNEDKVIVSSNKAVEKNDRIRLEV